MAEFLAYLGLHVIERQVIFVDLALAQIAALGFTRGMPVRVGDRGVDQHPRDCRFLFSRSADGRCGCLRVRAGAACGGRAEFPTEGP